MLDKGFTRLSDKSLYFFIGDDWWFILKLFPLSTIESMDFFKVKFFLIMFK